MSIYKQIQLEIENFDEILILGHKKPDADCIGSQQALGWVLRKIYPHKKIFTPYDNRRVKFLNFLKTDKTSINENTNFQNALLILVDCNKLERTDYPEIKNKKTVVIDHHEIDQKLKTNLNWIDESRASCTEMILELFLELNWKIDVEIATLLYCGMIMDNGNFTYNKVNKRSFELAAKLMKYKIPLRKIDYKINKINREDFEIKKFVMNNLEWYENYVIFRFFPEDKKKISITSDHQLTRHINIVKNIENLQFWIFFIQIEKDEMINCSLRSRENVNVRDIAKKFNGGGHLNAAGIKLKNKSDVEVIIQETVKQLPQNE